MKYVAALVSVLIVAVGAMVFGANRTPASSSSTATVEGFSLPALTGASQVSLDDRGAKPAVVNFFASWCAPCRKELPLFEQAAQEHGDEVAFFGVAHQDDAESAAEMLAEYEIDYPSGNDPEGTLARRYALRGMPSTMFITSSGRLLGIAAGELDDAGLQDWIERLLDA